jgi:hypothetical protein
MGIIASHLNLRSILRLLQTCWYLQLDKTLRTIVGRAKPGMIKAIKAMKKRGNKKKK